MTDVDVELTTLTPRQVRDALQLRSVDRVYNLIKSGDLRAVRVGGLWRISRAQFEEFLRGGAQ